VGRRFDSRCGRLFEYRTPRPAVGARVRRRAEWSIARRTGRAAPSYSGRFGQALPLALRTGTAAGCEEDVDCGCDLLDREREVR